MGVLAASIKALGLIAGLACLGILVAGVGPGAAGELGQSHGRRSTTSAAVALKPVRRPRPPARYAVPPRARRVSSSAQLSAALSDRRADTIVLAPGVYDNPRPFVDAEGDRIYSARLGRAVFRAGIELGASYGPPGALIRGLTFNVGDPSKVSQGIEVLVWGSATGASVLDTRLDGHGVVGAGLVVLQPNGFVARRIVARRFLSYGVEVDPNDYSFTARSPYSLRDLTISQVSRQVPWFVQWHRRGLPVARQPREGAAGERTPLRGLGDLDRRCDEAFASRGRHHPGRPRRDLHRALHDLVDLRTTTNRSQCYARCERRVGQPGLRGQAGQHRQRHRGRAHPDRARGRLPRPGDDPDDRPALRVRRAELGAIAATTNILVADTNTVRERIVQISTDGGFNSGWHIHPGPVIVQVQHGHLKITQNTCNPTVVGPGDTYIETPGQPVLATANKATSWTIAECSRIAILAILTG